MRRLIRSARLCTPESVSQADVLIDDGRVAAVGPGLHTKLPPCEVIDGTDCLLLAGMTDPHVHVRDFELAYKEDWTSACAAAIAGGVTGIYDMPNTIPPTEDRESLNAKRKRAGATPLRKRFFLGSTTENSDELLSILSERPADVAGIKLYLCESNPRRREWNPPAMARLFAAFAPSGYRIAVHTELPWMLSTDAGSSDWPPIDYGRTIRPRRAVVEGTRLICEMAASHGAAVHICHVSTSEEVDIIERFKKQADISAEVAQHHLMLSEDLLPHWGALAKVNPPLRTSADIEALRRALADGIIDCVGSDHAPHSFEEKTSRSFAAAPAGITALDIGLPLIYELVHAGDFGLERLAALMTAADGLFSDRRPPPFAPGSPADLVLLDPNSPLTVDASGFKSKARLSPYQGRRLRASVRCVILGDTVYRNDEQTRATGG